MARLSTKHFGDIDLDKLQEWYESEIELNGHTIDISITVSTKFSLEPKNIQAVDDYIENLKNNEQNIRRIIHQDFKEGGETRTYIDTL